MAEKDWRIPTLTKANGDSVKIWPPVELDYQEAEFAMKMFNERNQKGRLMDGLTTTDDIDLVIRHDRGSKSYIENVHRMLSERSSIEVKGNAQEFMAYLRSIEAVS